MAYSKQDVDFKELRIKSTLTVASGYFRRCDLRAEVGCLNVDRSVFPEVMLGLQCIMGRQVRVALLDFVFIPNADLGQSCNTSGMCSQSHLYRVTDQKLEEETLQVSSGNVLSQMSKNDIFESEEEGIYVSC